MLYKRIAYLDGSPMPGDIFYLKHNKHWYWWQWSSNKWRMFDEVIMLNKPEYEIRKGMFRVCSRIEFVLATGHAV